MAFSSAPGMSAHHSVGPITVTLIAKAAADLQITHERTRLSMTDIVNRAVSLYEFVDAELRTGAELILRRYGKDHRIRLL